jgi:hypothetical protein
MFRDAALKPPDHLGALVLAEHGGYGSGGHKRRGFLGEFQKSALDETLDSRLQTGAGQLAGIHDEAPKKLATDGPAVRKPETRQPRGPYFIANPARSVKATTTAAATRR